MFRTIVTITVIVMFASGSAYAHCGSCNMPVKSDQSSTGDASKDACAMPAQTVQTGSQQAMQSMEHMHGTMNAVYTADALYTCPMHPEIVSTQADMVCPCGSRGMSTLPL